MKLFFCYSKSYKLLKYEKEMFSRPYFALRFAPMWNPTAQHPVTCIINFKKNILITLIIEIIRPTNLLSFFLPLSLMSFDVQRNQHFI